MMDDDTYQITVSLTTSQFHFVDESHGNLPRSIVILLFSWLRSRAHFGF